MKDNKLNILWLSDIHFFHEYTSLSESESFNNYLNSFRSKIYLEHSNNRIDYVLITGDLAQQGTKEDYEAFWKMLLQPLLDTFLSIDSSKVPKVLTIPGNHDVKWDNVDFFPKYIEKLKPKISAPERAEFLSQETTSFRSLFNDYSEFIINFVTSAENSKYLNFFELKEEDGFEVSIDYKTNALYGYIIDHQNNSIFILFNSAWFSLGDKFNIEYAKHLHNKLKEKPTYDDLLQILKNKDVLTEFDNQIIGINIFDLDSLKSKIEQFPDYFVTTCMHHSLNWLNWHEYYTYTESDVNLNANKLNNILKKSDILLTGHEHVPCNYDNQRLLNETLYLRAGCFLFDDQINKPDLSYSWFSILKINIDSGSLKQIRYLYNEHGKDWEKCKPHFEHLPKKNSKYNLTNQRKSEILSKIKLTDADIIKEYFIKYKDREVNHAAKLDIESGHALFYEVLSENGYELCIVSNCKSFYKEIINANIFSSLIDMIMKKHDFKFKIVHFLSLDLYVDDDSYKAYANSEPYGRVNIFLSTYKRADTLFDFFRQNFFSRFEQKQTSVDNTNMLLSYYNLYLVNNVIPYWIYEKFFFRV